MAIGRVVWSVTPAEDSHEIALVLAFISTGSVIRLNSVVMANRPVHIHSSEGNTFVRIAPARSTHCTMLEEKDTTGTSAERIFRGA